MKVRIDSEKFEVLLGRINGRAQRHTYCVTDLLRIVTRAETRLHGVVARSRLKGARIIAVSGDAMPNSYRGFTVRTRVVLERGCKDWFVISIMKIELGAQLAGSASIMLTDAQEDEARRSIWRRFVEL